MKPTDSPSRSAITGLAKITSGFACLLTAFGCTNAIGLNGVDPVVQAPESARIRALHLAPNAPLVDVFVDAADDPAFSSLRFTRGSGYATLPAGTYDLDISPEGTTAADSVLSVAGAKLAEGISYTAVAYGSNDGLAALLIEDVTNSNSVGARIRAVHVAAGVGQVDLWALPTDGAPTPLAVDLDYGSSSPTLSVDAGAHIVGLDLDNDSSVDLSFQLPDLPQGANANVFAVTDALGAPFLLVQLSSGVSLRADPIITTVVPPTTEENALVRALHLSPDAPNVDVFVNEGIRPAFTDIPFAAGTGYAELPANDYRFRVSAAGTSAAAAVLDANGVTLREGAAHTVVAFGNLTAINAIVLEDNFEDVAPGAIRIRAIHAAQGVGQVDIYAYGTDGSTNLIYDDVDFGVAGDYLDIPAAAYTLGLDLDDDGLPEVRFDVPALAAGTVANIFAVTDASGNAFLLAQLQDGNTLRIDPSARTIESGQLRVIHFSPDAPPVDLFVNGADMPIVADLPFGSGTGFASLPARAFDVAVAASGSPAADAVLEVEDFEIVADAKYTVAAFDNLATIRGIIIEDDFSPVPAGKFRVRVVHTAIGIGNVDVIDLTNGGIPPVLYDDILLGTAGVYAELPVGQYILGIDLNDDRIPEARYVIPQLPAGTIANVFAVAELSTVYLVAQLNNGDTVRIDPS
jgi:hypothetical protein